MAIPKFSSITNSLVPISCEIIGWANIYNSKLGENVFVSPFVEIGGAVIGDRTRIGSHSYICPHVEIGRDCFIAHGVMFTNDCFDEPKEFHEIDDLRKNWTPKTTTIGNCVRIGSGAVILPVKIGDNAIIGAGAVVTRDVAAGEVVKGNPARSRYRK